MEIRVKKLHPDARIPRYAKPGDAGMDLYAVSRHFDDSGCVVYGTGLAFEIPEGYCGIVVPRSSIAGHPLSLTNSVGIIDSGYRGEVTAKFRPAMSYLYGGCAVSRNVSPSCRIYDVGERVAQIIIVPYPHIDLVEADELAPSERGTGGYGSTGV